MEGGVQAGVEGVKVGVGSASIGYCGTRLNLGVRVSMVSFEKRVLGRGGLQDRWLDSRRQPVMSLAVQRLLERRIQQLTFAL